MADHPGHTGLFPAVTRAHSAVVQLLVGPSPLLNSRLHWAADYCHQLYAVLSTTMLSPLGSPAMARLEFSAGQRPRSCLSAACQLPCSLLRVDVVGEHEAALQALVQGRGEAQRRSRSDEGRYGCQRQQRRPVIHLHAQATVSHDDTANDARYKLWQFAQRQCLLNIDDIARISQAAAPTICYRGGCFCLHVLDHTSKNIQRD